MKDCRKIYIAYIEKGDCYFYKVGISKNPNKRMYGLKYCYPVDDAVLLFVADAINDVDTERAIHAELKEHQVDAMWRCREWYTAPLDLIKDCVLRHTNNTHQFNLFKEAP